MGRTTRVANNNNNNNNAGSNPLHIKITKMSKIRLTNTLPEILGMMSEGNRGATNVLLCILKEGETIDPQSAIGGLGAILSLDTHRIYGSKIWMLYKDVCRQDLVKMLAVLRACQLGKLTEKAMLHAIDNYGDGLDVEAILETVKVELKGFGRASDAPPQVFA